MAGPGNGLTHALDVVLAHDELAELDAAQRRLEIRRLLVDAGIDTEMLAGVAAAIDGFGALDDLMRDPSVTDILVNAWDDIWIERGGALLKTAVSFGSPGDYDATIERLVSRGGGRADASRPIGDVTLPGGSRLHVVLPPLADGPKVSIRKFPAVPLTLSALHERGMFDADTHDRLTAAVSNRDTIAISGGTGSGKTTLLNALLGIVPATERIVTIEETAELRPACRHHVALVSRPPNVEGRGVVTLNDLLRASLRMRPDRIVVGEVRGPEAVVALDAMSTGHAGSLVTIHARSASDVESRFVALASAGCDLSEETLVERFRNAFDLVVHLERVSGIRRIAEVVEA